MIPHRLPPDVPLHLLALANAAEYGAERDDGTDWDRALREENRRAAFEATEAERAAIRQYGLVIGRGPAKLGERSTGDDRLGRAVLRELAAKARGG